MFCVKNLSVIGSGVMGRGIAYTAALNGFTVHVNDIKQEVLDQAKDYIEKELKKSAERGFIQSEDVERAIGNLTYTVEIKKAVKDADLVIEAVLEQMELKIEVFKKLDELCPAHTVLASNTSTMSPTEIGAQTSRPDKVIAMHFFNPVHKMKLIEIIRGLDTSDETVEITKNLGSQLGKETVEVNEFPGFVTSRMNCLIGNEAMNMLMEGIATVEDIDKAMKFGLNHPMGPTCISRFSGLRQSTT